MKLKHLFSLLFLLPKVCSGKPTAVSSDSLSSAAYYLMKTGWIASNENSDTAALLSADGLQAAIKDFQAFAGLDQTGELDDETVELMNTPRCGVSDVVGHGATTKRRRRKRYALQGSRWRTKTLTYRITRYPRESDRLSKDEVDSEIKKAFQLWEDQTDLNFERKNSGSVHIEIRFEKGEHGDGDPFDGPGGTLAHAYFPQYGGDAHFDDQEFWTIKEFRGTNLLQTAAHEFGHSLGLSHSDVRDALMAPFYRGWIPNLKLHKDDIQAIRALYGEKNTRPNPTTTRRPATTTRRPNQGGGGGGGGGNGGNRDNRRLCNGRGDIDTVFNTIDGTYYVFKGNDYWELTDDAVKMDGSWPKRISDDWDGLPGNIDAAVTWPDNGMTFFFKGSEYWKFKNKRMQGDYPKKIREGFKGVPNDVDAAFVWGGNGKIYFFKGDEYWKFDPTRKPPVRSVYPRDRVNWDLPRRLAAAVQWSNGYTYFFTTGGDYYRFDDRNFSMDDGDPAFPRDAGKWWFGCPGLDVKAVEKDQASIVSLFDEVGSEDMDVVPTDEDA